MQAYTDTTEVARSDRRVMTFDEWTSAVLSAHWDINFTEFCRRAGFTEDDYAEDKWQKWLALAASLNAFDSQTLQRIVGVDA